MAWVFSNASNRSRLFNLFDLHYNNEKKNNFLKISILNRKFYLKFFEQIESEILIPNFFDKWSHLTVKLFFSKEKTEILLFMNGLNLTKITYHKPENNSFLNENLELIMGFDCPVKKKQVFLNEKNIDDKEFFRLGPALFFEESLSAGEINLLYSVMDFYGNVNLLRNEHDLNMERMKSENFTLMGVEFPRKPPDFFTLAKEFQTFFTIKSNLNYLIDSLAIEICPENLILLKNREKRSLILLNKSEKNSENSLQGQLFSDSKNSDFCYEKSKFLNKKNCCFQKMEENVLILLNSLLEKEIPDESARAFFKFSLENFSFSSRNAVLILEIFRKKSFLFDGVLMESLYFLFAKKIPISDETSCNFLITSIYSFQSTLMNPQFYKDFFNKNQEILSYLEMFCRNFFFNNLFAEINRCIAKDIGFMSFLVNMCFYNQFNGIEEDVFGILYEFLLKPVKFDTLDKRILEEFANFSYVPFSQSFQIEGEGKTRNSSRFLEEKEKKNEKNLQIFEILWDFQRCQKMKLCFLVTFNKIFEAKIDEPPLDYKLILQLLYLNAKNDLFVAGRKNNRRVKIIKGLLQCLFMTLQKKNSLKSFFEDNEKVTIMNNYCAFEEFFYFMLLILIEKDCGFKKNYEFFERVDEFFNEKNTLEEHQINLIIFLLEILGNSFEILKNTVILLNKENQYTLKFGAVFDEPLPKRTRSSEKIVQQNTFPKEVDVFTLVNQPNPISQANLLTYYNKSNNEDLLKFPDIHFQLLITGSLFKILLKQRHLKSYSFVNGILENILRILSFLKEIHEKLHKAFMLNTDSLDILGFLLSQLSFLNENNEDKNEFFMKIQKIETQILKLSSEDVFFEIMQKNLQSIAEICELNESNFTTEISKNLMFSLQIYISFLMKKNSYRFSKFASIFLISLLKKYIYEDKTEVAVKKKGLLSNWIGKFSSGDQKKQNIRQNKQFFNDIQQLLKKTVISLMKICEKDVSEQVLVDLFTFIEVNTKILMENSLEYLDFFHCLFYFCYKFIEK